MFHEILCHFSGFWTLREKQFEDFEEENVHLTLFARFSSQKIVEKSISCSYFI